MDEKTKIKNQKDLKFYRLVIAVVFIITIAIAIVVAIVTIDSYSAEAFFTNKALDVLMDDEITSSETIDGKYITFGREVNDDYDVNNDQPIDAFNYYYLDGNGEKTYLTDGIYYPSDYYKEGSDSTPVAVYLGFYYSALEHIQIIKNVLKVIFSLLFILLIAFLIYLWYRSWCKRQEKAKELKKLNR